MPRCGLVLIGAYLVRLGVSPGLSGQHDRRADFTSAIRQQDSYNTRLGIVKGDTGSVTRTGQTVIGVRLGI
jgi:hypothetical protein